MYVRTYIHTYIRTYVRTYSASSHSPSNATRATPTSDTAPSTLLRTMNAGADAEKPTPTARNKVMARTEISTGFLPVRSEMMVKMTAPTPWDAINIACVILAMKLSPQTRSHWKKGKQEKIRRSSLEARSCNMSFHPKAGKGLRHVSGSEMSQE